MKKLFLLSALCFAAVFAHAQKPSKNSVTAEVQLNFQTGAAAVSVVSPNLKGRYFFKDQTALRGLIGISSLTADTTFYENPDGTGGKGTQEVSGFQTRIAAGIERHVKGSSRLSPYFGAEIYYSWGVLGEVKSNSTDGLTYVQDLIWSVVPGTTTQLAVVGLLGADYYFVDKVYLGVEVSWGYYSSSTGQGEEKVTTLGGTAKAVVPESSWHGFQSGANSGLRLGFVF